VRKILLGAAGFAESVAAIDRFESRKTYFADAQRRAAQVRRPLVVIGAPGAGAHTRLMPAYGCGDVCIDLVGCDGCPVSITADLTQGHVAQVQDNSAVVYVSCVLEYVSDPQAAWNEILRMAGSVDNVFVVTVQPWTVTSVLYPGSRWMITKAPPEQSTFEFQPVGGAKKLVYAGALAFMLFGR